MHQLVGVQFIFKICLINRIICLKPSLLMMQILMDEVHKLKWSLINLYFGHLCLFPSTINQPVPCFPVAAHNCKFTKTLVTFEHVTSLSGASDSIRGWAVSIIKHWTGFGQLCVIIVGIFLPPLCASYKVLTLWQIRQNSKYPGETQD